MKIHSFVATAVGVWALAGCASMPSPAELDQQATAVIKASDVMVAID